jgi:hypothetical protein
MPTPNTILPNAIPPTLVHRAKTHVVALPPSEHAAVVVIAAHRLPARRIQPAPTNAPMIAPALADATIAPRAPASNPSASRIARKIPPTSARSYPNEHPPTSANLYACALDRRAVVVVVVVAIVRVVVVVVVVGRTTERPTDRTNDADDDADDDDARSCAARIRRRGR